MAPNKITWVTGRRSLLGLDRAGVSYRIAPIPGAPSRGFALDLLVPSWGGLSVVKGARHGRTVWGVKRAARHVAISLSS